MNTQTDAAEILIAMRAEAQRRLIDANLQNGRWYSIHEAGQNSVHDAQFYKCEIVDGVTYLIADMCDFDRRSDNVAEADEACDVITAKSVIIAF